MNDFLRQHIEDIISLTDDEFAFVSSFFTVKKLRRHQFLVQPGEPVNAIYLTVRGCLKAYYFDQDGKEHILQFAVEDWWVSDFQAFFTRADATISVDCIEDSELLALSYDDREKICAAVHKMEHFFFASNPVSVTRLCNSAYSRCSTKTPMSVTSNLQCFIRKFSGAFRNA